MNHNHLKFLFLVIFSLAYNITSAQTWEGDVNSDWNNKDNWSGNVIPAGQSVTIDIANYTNAPVLSSNSTFSVSDITIQGAGTVLTFNSNVSISGKSITVKTGATFNSAATITLTQDLNVNSSSTANLTGGSISGRDVIVDGGSELNNSGTALTAWQDLIISGASTEVTFTGGSRSGRDVIVEDGATFNNDGGTFTPSRKIEVADNGSVINLKNGSFSTVDLNVDAGTIFNMTGGTATLSDDVVVNSSTMSVDGDSAVLNITDDLILLDASSYFNLYKGYVYIGGDLVLAGDACGCNTVNANIYGGTLEIDGAINVYTKNASTDDYPSLSVTDGEVEIDGLEESGATGGRQLINIDGGDVTFTDVTVEEGDTINQTDGTMNIDGTFTNDGMVFNVSGGSVTFEDGVANLEGAGFTEFYELEVNDTNGLVITRPIYIKGKLTLLNGKIHFQDSGAIILRDSATSDLGSDSSYVVGPITKQGVSAFVFAVGDSTKYAPIGMSAPATYSEFTASFHSNAGSDTNSVDSATLTNVSGNEHWVLNRDSGTAEVKVTLYWFDGAYSAINKPSELLIAEYNGSNWKSMGNSGFTGHRYVGSVTSDSTAKEYNQYTFASNNVTTNPLPVEWLYFDAYNEAGKVMLEWGTASEKDNDYFVVERTVDGKNYEEVGRVAAVGNSINIQDYSFVDESPLAGVSFYRIRQVDYNGENEHTKWEKVVVNADNETIETTVNVYPNPVNAGSAINFDIKGFNSAIATDVVVTNHLGAIVYNGSVNNTTGALSIDLQPGLYFVSFTQNNEVITQKLVVK